MVMGMTRREFIKKIALYGTLTGFSGVSLASFWTAPTKGNVGDLDYHRIVLFGDPHLPFREREIKTESKQQRVLAAKQAVIDDVNSWNDVSEIQVLGDVVAQFGNEEEYEWGKHYFFQLLRPVYFINGNHDYIYQHHFSPSGKFMIADSALREQKLAKFKATFSLSNLYYSRKMGQYLLLYLSPDSLESPQLTEMTLVQLNWVRQELACNKSSPTIIFFHAPLAGTLLPYNRQVNSPAFTAQPEQAVNEIIAENRQIVLWVSGHTHTPATNPSFAHPVNLFAGHLLNLHNTDMDREVIWTNSLYLYSDRIVIRTFNHYSKNWEKYLERQVFLTHLSG